MECSSTLQCARTRAVQPWPAPSRLHAEGTAPSALDCRFHLARQDQVEKEPVRHRSDQPVVGIGAWGMETSMKMLTPAAGPVGQRGTDRFEAALPTGVELDEQPFHPPQTRIESNLFQPAVNLKLALGLATEIVRRVRE